RLARPMRLRSLARCTVLQLDGPIQSVVTTRCPRCRSTYVEILLEITTRFFLRCGACGHRWNVARGEDTERPRTAQLQPHSSLRTTPRVRDARAHISGLLYW